MCSSRSRAEGGFASFDVVSALLRARKEEEGEEEEEEEEGENFDTESAFLLPSAIDNSCEGREREKGGGGGWWEGDEEEIHTGKKDLHFAHKLSVGGSFPLPPSSRFHSQPVLPLGGGGEEEGGRESSAGLFSSWGCVGWGGVGSGGGGLGGEGKGERGSFWATPTHPGGLLLLLLFPKCICKLLAQLGGGVEGGG